MIKRYTCISISQTSYSISEASSFRTGFLFSERINFFGFLDRLGDVIVRLADTLVTADLGVLTLTLLHEGLELSIIRLGNGLGLHLDD